MNKNMKKSTGNALVLGLTGAMLSACGGGSADSQESMNSAQKRLTVEQKATLPACYTPWVSTTAYTVKGDWAGDYVPPPGPRARDNRE